MKIRIRSTQKKRRTGSARLASKVEQLLRILDLDDAELGLLLVGERAIRTLNRTYRGKDKATDVLSFPLRGGPYPHVCPEQLGDIIICVPIAARQAAAYGHPLAAEIDRLVVHGLLHLLGYDHERGPRDARRMANKECLLLKRLAA